MSAAQQPLWSLGIVIDSSIATALIVFGVIFALFGCRIFKIFLFSVGLGLGFALGYYGVLYVLPDKQNIALILGGILGLIMALITLGIFKFGIFVAGAVIGIAVVYLFDSAFPGLLQPLWLNLVVMFVAAIIGGLVIIRVAEERIAIVASASIGAFALAIGVDYFTVLSMNPMDVLSGGGCKDAICYVTIGMVGLIALCGIFVQYKWVRSGKSSDKKKDGDEDEKDEKEQALLAEERARNRQKQGRKRAYTALTMQSRVNGSKSRGRGPMKMKARPNGHLQDRAQIMANLPTFGADSNHVTMSIDDVIEPSHNFPRASRFKKGDRSVMRRDTII